MQCMESQSKVLLEKFIAAWNEMANILNNTEHILELVEKDYPNPQVKGMRIFDIIIKQVNQSKPILFINTWNYAIMREEIIALMYDDLLQNILFRGFSESIRDWESGKLEMYEGQIVINPTAGDLLAKAGLKLVKI